MTPQCPYCTADTFRPTELRKIIRFGRFRRTSDSHVVQRFRCTGCVRTFSHATFAPEYKQIKRQHNLMIKRLLCSAASQRRIAKLMCVNRKTVVRKLLYLAGQAQLELDAINLETPNVEVLEIDDQETIEHTKCKPLSILCAVETGSRRILGFGVARMPAKGPLAKISLAKYGKRKDERAQVRKELFAKLQKLVHPNATIKSDMSAHYVRDLKAFFPEANHEQFKGRKSSLGGQGELKKIGFDPIFSINHTFAMMRANINRLVRKTWCTTKRPDRLLAHLTLYALYHNTDLIHKQLQPN